MERVDGVGGGGMAPPGGVVGSAAAEMLGLDVHLAPQQMHAFRHQPDPHHGGFQLQQQQVRQPPSFSPYSNASSSRVVVSAAAVGHDDDTVGNGKGAVVQQAPPPPQQVALAACPWTRMKWTDDMVRLLIRVVYSVGDDGEGLVAGGGGGGGGGGGKASKAGPSSSHAHSAAHAQQQKKGKWKSVSRAMMEKGFVVSPQQCEDKFNDLNKRYKRVTELLPRGRACKVVENHALLDAIKDMPAKAKDEARKLLSSKHLFFREMCAYHNGGGGGSGSHLAPHGTACLDHPPPAPVALAARNHAQQLQQAPVLSPTETKDSSADDSDDVVVSNNNNNNTNGGNDADYDDDEEGHMYQNAPRPRSRSRSSGGKRVRGEDSATARERDDEADDAETTVDLLARVQQLRAELASAAAAADPQQARSRVRRRVLEVEEEQLLVESQACDLQKKRLRWERFRAKKDRDVERARLENDRLRIEGRRMLLLLRQKDLELDAAEANSSSVDHHLAVAAGQQQQIGSSPSTGAGHPN